MTWSHLENQVAWRHDVTWQRAAGYGGEEDEDEEDEEEEEEEEEEFIGINKRAGNSLRRWVGPKRCWCGGQMG